MLNSHSCAQLTLRVCWLNKWKMQVNFLETSRSPKLISIWAWSSWKQLWFKIFMFSLVSLFCPLDLVISITLPCLWTRTPSTSGQKTALSSMLAVFHTLWLWSLLWGPIWNWYDYQCLLLNFCGAGVYFSHSYATFCLLFLIIVSLKGGGSFYNLETYFWRPMYAGTSLPAKNKTLMDVQTDCKLKLLMGYSVEKKGLRQLAEGICACSQVSIKPSLQLCSDFHFECVISLESESDINLKIGMLSSTLNR